MQDTRIEVRRGALCLSTDRRRLDRSAVLALLRTAYWGSSLTLDVLNRAIDHSICFAVFDGETLIAFGRAVTDLATYAYWTDVVVAEAYRRQGIGRWLSETMLAHPQLQGLRRVSLHPRPSRHVRHLNHLAVPPGPQHPKKQQLLRAFCIDLAQTPLQLCRRNGCAVEDKGMVRFELQDKWRKLLAARAVFGRDVYRY